jgi:YVTN family beta-propeller protein
MGTRPGLLILSPTKPVIRRVPYRTRTIAVFASVVAFTGAATRGAAQDGIMPTASSPYSIYVASESGDIVTRIDVGPDGWRKAREVSVKLVPTGISGPHNVAVSQDGRFWYVSIAHGTPTGAIWKYEAESDRLVGRAGVGMFPTTIALSPDGSWAYVPNTDFHGDRGRRNTVSALYTPTMAAVTEIEACDMPHGARWSHAGSAVYIACMMSDELLVIDPGALAIRERVPLGSASTAGSTEIHAGHGTGCMATYVTVSPDDRTIYIACNHSNELQVRDAASLELRERVEVGTGAYNVEASADGRLILVTNKKAQSVSIIDVQTLRELARVPTSAALPHGIAFSPDGRYAFISCEAVGTAAGAVDAIDLRTLQRVASIAVPLQPTGIAVRSATVR